MYNAKEMENSNSINRTFKAPLYTIIKQLNDEKKKTFRHNIIKQQKMSITIDR